MCGICGLASNRRTPDPAVVIAMMASLHHRGPDGSGYVVDHGAVLGQTRLAIIDEVGGVQPLSNEDDSVWVTFNGEIYNYVELGEQLRARGHRFRTASDTEVIVHAWEEWGADCFTRFNGQWAIGIWDRRLRRLTLARDRLGVRPLYYRLDRGGICFASEVKAIFVDPAAPREFDPVGIDQILTYWSTIAPRTPFLGIAQLPPGHMATFDADGFRSRPYWSITFPPRGREPGQDLDENAAGLRERVIEATRLRFERSDVPVGAYLSGGLDSSVTAAAIRHFTGVPLTTFSIRFTEAEFDEGPYQRLMAHRLGTIHHEVEVSARDIAEVFPAVMRHVESPVLRTAPAPMYLLAGLVRRSGYKVVVTGEGADEVLGGYDIFREARVRGFWARNPHSNRRDRAVELLYPWMATNPGQAPAFARGFFGLDLDPADPAMSHRPRWNTTSRLRSLLTEGMRAESDKEPAVDLAATLPPDSSCWDPLARAQWLEMTTLLPGYILASQGDRMLMANSVEGRFPFLDPDVVEYANALPARHKLFGLDEKFLLKHAFADLVPEEIRNRPKQPYRAPDALSFFTADAPDWVDDVTSPQALLAAGVFDPLLVAGLLKKARQRSERFGNSDNMRVLAVLSTQLVQAELLDAPASPRDGGDPPHPLHVFDLVHEEREER
ncbi:MAG TPA: asparagine synthase (glutamine-hydrolyzing) [Propionicimonas sp.]|jgi:asparagine synthase (glutamine-hydrolysing)